VDTQVNGSALVNKFVFNIFLSEYL
jgi:hypothetical protein